MKDSLFAQSVLLNELITAASEPLLKAAGISTATFELLSAVKASGGRATQVEVARRLGITPPSLSEAVASAVRRELLEQVKLESDGRARLLRLTEQGNLAVQKVLKAIARLEREAMAGIDEKAESAALELLKRMNRNLSRSLQD